MTKDWRDELSSDIESKLNKLLKNVKMHQKAYYNSKNPLMAQIWVALSDLQSKMDLLDQRITGIERILNENNIKPKRKINKELRDSLDEY